MADRLFAWLFPRLKPTLSVDDQLTKEAMEQAAKAVPEVLVDYSVGQTAGQGRPAAGTSRRSTCSAWNTTRR